MKYSFTAPQPKSIISHLTKIWLFYLVLSLFIIYCYGIYLQYRISAFIATAQTSNIEIDTQDAGLDNMNAAMDRLRYQIALDSQNKAYNNDLTIAVTKLFDIIPDQITINYLQLEPDKLTLKGITPTRENYKFLLEAPLKSTFTKSRADFFALPNGWYNFTSISTVGDE